VRRFCAAAWPGRLAQLADKVGAVVLRPLLNHAAAAQATDDDSRPPHRGAGWSHAGERSAMRTATGHAYNDLVALRDQILNGYAQIRERAAQPLNVPFDAGRRPITSWELRSAFLVKLYFCRALGVEATERLLAEIGAAGAALAWVDDERQLYFPSASGYAPQNQENRAGDEDEQQRKRKS
jgi:hypothetical protein